MNADNVARLRHADRHSQRIRLAFKDGGTVEARVRDVDWDRHHTLTYQCMDDACALYTAGLNDIETVLLLPD